MIRRIVRALALLLVVALAAAGAIAALAWRELGAFADAPYGSDREKVVEVAPGASPRQIVRQLAAAGVLSDERRAWGWLRFTRWRARDHRALRAGEYAFSGPLRPAEVLERIYRGEVKLHLVTIPEGLRLEEIAGLVEAAGLGHAAELALLARDPAFARELGVPAPGLEGFLFPDTYSFPKGPKARAVLTAMVDRFKAAWRAADARRDPAVRLDELQAVTLASIVEKETGRPDERPRIACVFHNRLRKGMRLQTDPTVMYAAMLRHGGQWSHNITRDDLLAVHPYNTYTVAGLPPGPIASPGAAALEAALRPSPCDDLFFVSRNDGTHVFCPDLRCHEAAVRKWQVEFFRRHRR